MIINAKNKYNEVVVDGITSIEFITGGKYQVRVLVDKKTWDEYLHKYHWTALKSRNYITIKTSIDKQSSKLVKVIVEHEFSQLDYWGNTIDHRNNNPLDTCVFR